MSTELDASRIMVVGNSMPEQGFFDHCLWALMLTKIYQENETDMCSVLGDRHP